MTKELQVINEQKVLGKDFKIYGDIENPLFLAKDVSEWIEHSNTSSMLSTVDEGEKKLIRIDTINNSYSAWFLTEDGVYEILMLSRKPIAKEFKKKVKDILKQLRQTGSVDTIENNINKIQDEKERGLTLAIYNFQKVIESNPSDFMTGILLQQKKAELESYKQEKRLNKVEESVNLIQEQSVFIPDRITFSEKINILARKYFNKEVAEAYRTLYNKMKILGGFDVPRRLENRKEQIQLDRLEQGRKPYAESTLKTKVTGLDIIEEFDKWELAGEAYKAIENERFLESK